jgi:hypothetical protein
MRAVAENTTLGVIARLDELQGLARSQYVRAAVPQASQRRINSATRAERLRATRPVIRAEARNGIGAQDFLETSEQALPGRKPTGGKPPECQSEDSDRSVR